MGTNCVFFCFGVFFFYYVASNPIIELNTVPEDPTDYPDDYEDESSDLNSTITNATTTLKFTRELINLTKYSGDEVRLRCEVRNLDNASTSKVTFKWHQNEAPLQKNKRFKIKFRQIPNTQRFVSLLRIIDLEPTDTGFYKCIATNKIDKIESEGVLKVNNKIGGGWSDYSSLKSIYEDEHPDDLTTFEPKFENRQKGEVFSTVSHPVISNTVSLPKQTEPGFKDVNMFESPTLKVQKLPSYNASVPFCQLYKGNTCKKYLDNYYVFIQPPYTQEDIEAKLENAVLVVSQSNDISTSCSTFALPSLCFSAFPICSQAHRINSYQEEYINKYYKTEKQPFKNIRNELTHSLQRICKKDCILLETELCSREYAIAKRHPVIGQVLELEECEFLPEVKDMDFSCLKLGVDRTQDVNKDDTCYWDSGELYRGIQDKSISGTKCLRWAHQFQFQLSEHPELIGNSYCRNPEGLETEPFCFIEQNKREVCGLPRCSNVLWIYIVGIISATFTLLIVSVIFVCCRKKRRKTRALQNIIPSADKNIYGNSGPNSPMELSNLLPSNIPPARSSHSTNKNAYQNVTHYTYKEVSFVEELGEGAFGKVYKGELKMKTGKIFVAVKSLKENANAKTQADFQREIELISELKHPNIICLLGVVIKQEPMCMIFEFMSEGDLHEFLIANSPNEGKSLTQIQFLHIAIQIAQGMEYLSDNHYVHRDLAARNCLVSKDLTVKISDFGLSRDMYSCDYYRVQSKSLLPVRWMPPESILYGKFTTESDVWSYGVVLWEIYSYGLQPYYGYNNQEVINMIRARKLLPCPEACPGYCYALMVECWAELAIRRPSFAEISHRLRVWKQNGSYTGAYFKPPEVVNVQKHGHTSKSSLEQGLLCPTVENPADFGLSWERNLKRNSNNHLNESQSSLTSRCSSLGNKTQSTSLSERNVRKGGERKGSRCSKNEGSLDRGSGMKNVVVNANGENFECKVAK